MTTDARDAAVMTGAVPIGRRRRTISCDLAGDDVEVQKFYEANPKLGNIHASTVCMDYHILSRLEGDVKRAEMRQENPESAMPDRGYEHEEEAHRAVEEYHSTQQLPDGARLYGAGAARADTYLPALTPRSSRARRPSRGTSRRPSRSNSRSLSRRNSALFSPLGNRNAPAPSSRGPFASPTQMSPAQSPSHGDVSTPSRGVTTRAPANGHLPPLEKPSRTEAMSYRDDGRVVAEGGPRHDRQLFLEAGALQAESSQQQQQPARDVERERRLRLAEQLANMMESAE